MSKEPEAPEPQEHNPARRILASVMGDTWAITEAGRDKLIEIASRENVLTPEVLQEIQRNQEAVAAKRAARMDNTVGVMKRGAVAVIDVTGPITRYADLFSQISGATSIDTLATDLNAALNDPSVQAIVLNFNSPGGQTAGINEFAAMIAYRANRKPVVAYVGVMAASAAYWIAAACDEIVIEELGEVGSIGIRVSVRKQSPAVAASTVDVFSRRARKKGLSPDSEEGLASMRRQADVVEDVFVNNVAAWRKLTAEQVTAAEGELLIGREAITAKLADRLGSLESLIESLGRPRVAGSISNVNKGAIMSKEAAVKKAEEPCAAFVPSDDDANICATCGYPYGDHAKEAKKKGAKVDTAEVVASMQAQIDALTKLAEQHKADADAAVTAKITAEANAQVDAFERDGRLAGDGTAAFRDIYIAAATGQAVTREQMDKLAANLPQIPTDRISKETPKKPGVDVTKADFAAAGNDAAAAKRISDALRTRQKADAKYTLSDLRAEVIGK